MSTNNIQKAIEILQLINQPPPDPEMCSICLEPLSDKGVVTLKCAHTIHLDCFLPMIRTSVGTRCPLCRRDIDGLDSHPRLHLQIEDQILEALLPSLEEEEEEHEPLPFDLGNGEPFPPCPLEGNRLNQTQWCIIHSMAIGGAGYSQSLVIHRTNAFLVARGYTRTRRTILTNLRCLVRRHEWLVRPSYLVYRRIRE